VSWVLTHEAIPRLGSEHAFSTRALLTKTVKNMPARKRRAAPMLENDTDQESYEAKARTTDDQTQPAAEYHRQMPLVCKLCPKASTFSDLSHLLTHVASKGHLHNQFKLGLAKDTDPAAAQVLTEYDAWYSEFGLTDLLKTRSDSREQRQKSNQIRANELAVSLGKPTKQPKVPKAKTKTKPASYSKGTKFFGRKTVANVMRA
jgi:hypothetical protein